MNALRRLPGRIQVFILLIVLLVAFRAADREGTEAIEIGHHNAELLPQGKEADGIVGDFLLRNGRIHALIAGNLPERRANMMHEKEFPIPGALIDLDLLGSNNDQITSFRPGHLGGDISYVRVVDDGSDGAASVEAVRTSAKGGGLFTRHEYVLQEDWQHILVRSTYRNDSDGTLEIQPRPFWKAPIKYPLLTQFSDFWQIGEIRIGDSIDPFDKRAYAWTPVGEKGPLLETVTLQPGAQKDYAVALTVSDSPLAAYGVAAAVLGATGRVEGQVIDQDGQAAVHASVFVEVGQTEISAYPSDAGRYSFALPPGRYQARLFDLGRTEERRSFTVEKGTTAPLSFSPSRASAVSFRIQDAEGRPSPAKVQFLGLNTTPTPYLGTDYRAHGCDHQYHSHDGEFTQQLPPGNYRIRITRGPEFDLVERDIQVAQGALVEVEAVLKRTVDTKGWISTDYHAHSTPSGDNHCNSYDRIINFAAEHVEFIPTTEHNRLYDWQPHIDRLGLTEQMSTVIGIELTGSGQHLNAFPLQYYPLRQDGGAPQWQFDPRLNAIVLRNLFGEDHRKWVQVNHPRVGEVFNDRDADGVADGGFRGFEDLIDAAEVWSTEILNLNPTYEMTRVVNSAAARGVSVAPAQSQRTSVGENRTFGWLQLLNQGRHVWCVAVSDAHRVFGRSGVGGWRTYVRSSTDDPGELDPDEIIRNSRAGQMMITNGPFLRVRTAGGEPIGARIVAPGSVTLKVQVQTPNWLNIDRVQILVNGRQPDQYNFTRQSHPGMFHDGVVQFEEDVQVKLSQDAHLIVVATGESSTLEKGWGRAPQGGMHPVAFTNPIYADVDGNGFRANGDNLGHPLLVAMPAD